MTHNQRELLRNILYEKRNFMKYETDRLFLHLRPDIYEYMKDQMTNWKEYFTCAIVRHTTLAGMEAIEDKELEEPFKIEVIWLKEGELGI